MGSRLTLLVIVSMMVMSTVPMSMADTIDRLSSGETTVTLDFDAAGHDSDEGLTVPFDAIVTSATLRMEGGAHVAGDSYYPQDPSLDIGDDGDLEYAFQGTGYGSMGHQSMFVNGSNSLTVETLWPESNTDASIRLPKSANVVSAQVDIDGVAGYDAWAEKEISRSNMGEEIGHSVCGFGDINGDGLDDVGAVGRGKFLIYFGKFGDFSETPDISIDTGFTTDRLWRIGDVNGDGLDDILKGTGVHFGGETVNSTADVVLTSLGKGNGFGSSASWIGDIDGDSIDDILVGDAGDGMGYVGAAYIYYGGQSMDGTPDIIFDNPTGTNGEGFGDSVTYAGDLNNDTYFDIAISAMWGGPNNEGIVYIYYGSSSFDNTSDLSLTGDLDGGSWPKFGNYISGGGDLDQDGYDDLVVGAFNHDHNGTDNGKVYIFFGGDPMDNAKDLEMFGSAPAAFMGSIVRISEDLNGDGVVDLIVSERGSGFGAPQNVLVFYGGNGFDNVSDWKKSGLDPNNYSFGWSVSPTGDMIGMGTSSLVVGAPQQWMNRYGKLYFYNIYGMEPGELELKVDGQRLWNETGVFDDIVTISDFSAVLNGLLGGLPATATDQYGNQYIDLVVNLSVVNGLLRLTNLTIGYTYSPTVDFTTELNDLLSQAIVQQGQLDVVVPLNVTVSSPGKVTIKDIAIDFTPNQVPTAVIDSITPNPGRLTQDMVFQGHGTDADGTIVGYRWTSNRMGLLSTVQNPTLDNLTTGVHNISLEVVDDRGRVSAPDHEMVEVLPPNVGPVVTIDSPSDGKEVTGIITVKGTAMDLNNDPLSVYLRIDDGQWLDVTGTDPWTHQWDTRTVADGPHDISARAWDTFDNSTIVSVSVTVNNTEIGDDEIDFSVTAPIGALAMPGDTVAYEFTVTNIGAVADTYSWTAVTENQWTVTPSSSTKDLDAGKSGVIEVSVTVPLDAGDTVEELTITITSDADPSIVRVAKVSTSVGVAGVELMPPEDRAGTPGGVVKLVFVIRNIGTVPDMYKLEPSSASSWDVMIGDGPGSDTTDEMQPNASTLVQLDVTVPMDVVGPLQEHITLKASSLMDVTKEASAGANILIGSLGVNVTAPNNQSVKAGRNATYEFSVVNTGDLKAVFLVTAVSSNGWVVLLEVEELELEPGAISTVKVNVTVPDKTKSRTKDELELKVVAKADPTVLDMAKVTTTVKAKKEPTKGIIPGFTTSSVAATFGLSALLLVFFRIRRGN